MYTISESFGCRNKIYKQNRRIKKYQNLLPLQVLPYRQARQPLYLPREKKRNKVKECFKMAKSKLVKANEKIAEGVVEGYKKIENGVVNGYKKIENGVVGGFAKMTDKFVDEFLTREGESVEDAKKRLSEEQAARDEQPR